MSKNKEVKQEEIVSNTDEKSEVTEEQITLWYKPAFSKTQCEFLAKQGVISLSLGTEKREPTYTGSLKADIDNMYKAKFPDYPMESRELKSAIKSKEKIKNDVMKIAPNLSQEELIELAKKLNSLIIQ